MWRVSMTGLIFLSLVATAHAEVYKWVDEDGHVQYSDNPQAIKKAQSVPMQKIPQPDPETLKRSENQQRYLDARDQERQKAQTDKENSAKQAAESKKQCDSAKERLAMLQMGGRIYNMDANGERNYISEEKRQAEIATMQDEVAKYCK